MAKKHIKFDRRTLTSEHDAHDWPSHWGKLVWWRSLPTGALNHFELCTLAQALIKDRNLRKRLYAVYEHGMLRSYDVGISQAHMLQHLDAVYFDNFWLASAFSQRIKKLATGG